MYCERRGVVQPDAASSDPAPTPHRAPRVRPEHMDMLKLILQGYPVLSVYYRYSDYS